MKNFAIKGVNMDNKQTPVYINKEISSANEDLIGFEPHANAIRTAIDDGASLIGVLADYGAGKSSLCELIANDKTYKRPIKVNMWDCLTNIQETQNKTKDDNDDTIAKLDQAFLYQIAAGSGDHILANHINKRFHKGSGLLSISMRTKKFIWALIPSILFLIVGVILHGINFVFSIPKINLSIPCSSLEPVAYICAAISLFVGIVKCGVAFTSWKSENERIVDNTDCYDAYFDILKSLGLSKKSSKKQIIIVEDLDRIKDTNIIKRFLRELYKFNNLSSKKYKIYFIVGICPEKQESENGCKEYDKIFDYAVTLKPIHIDDFEIILKDLLKEKELIAKGDSIADYYPLIECIDNLTIRELKARLNSALILKQSIEEKGYKNSNSTKVAVSIKTCCCIVALDSLYPNEFKFLIEHNKEFSAIIRDAITVKLHSHKMDEELNKIEDVIIRAFPMASQSYKGWPSFCKLLTKYIAANDINDDYRMYCYSYPRNSYIRTYYEDQLYKLLTQDINNYDESLDSLVEHAKERNDKTIEDALGLLESNDVLFSAVIFENEYLLQYACRKYEPSVIKTMTQDLRWEESNMDHVVVTLKRIYEFDIPQINTIFSKYIQEAVSVLRLESELWRNCRMQLIEAFGGGYEFMQPAYLGQNAPKISKEEMHILSDPARIISFTKENYVSQAYLESMWDEIESFDNDSANTVLEWIEKTVSEKNSKPFAKMALRFMVKYSFISNKIMQYIAQNDTDEEEIVGYLNNIAEKVTEEYVTIIVGRRYVGLNDAILSRIKKADAVTYILNKICGNSISEDDYATELCTKSSCARIMEIDSQSFVKYRSYIQNLAKDKQTELDWIFKDRNLPIAQDELDNYSINFVCSVIGHDAVGVSISVNNLCEYFSKKIDSCQDAYIAGVFALNDSYDWVNLFRNIPFREAKFFLIDDAKKQDMLDLYCIKSKFNYAEDVLAYMELTFDHFQSCDEYLLELLPEDWDSEYEKRYVDLVNEQNNANVITARIVASFSSEIGLCDSLTKQLIKIERFEKAVIGQTLYYKNFLFDKAIPMYVYVNLFNNNDGIAMYMEQNNDFKIALSNNIGMKELKYKRLKSFNDWDQNRNMFTALVSNADSINEVVDYLRNIRVDSIKSDYAEMVEIIRASKYAEALLDEDVQSRIKDNGYRFPKSEQLSINRKIGALKRMRRIS